MTTSFAWFVRGNWLASFYVQPMGFVLALGTGALFWASLFIDTPSCSASSCSAARVRSLSNRKGNVVPLLLTLVP